MSALSPQATTDNPAVCSTSGCGYPVQDVELWAEKAKREIPRYWVEEFKAAGNPASPEGLCSDCGTEWFSALSRFCDVNRCLDGTCGCSPFFDRCHQLVLSEDE